MRVNTLEKIQKAAEFLRGQYSLEDDDEAHLQPSNDIVLKTLESVDLGHLFNPESGYLLSDVFLIIYDHRYYEKNYAKKPSFSLKWCDFNLYAESIMSLPESFTEHYKIDRLIDIQIKSINEEKKEPKLILEIEAHSKKELPDYCKKMLEQMPRYLECGNYMWIGFKSQNVAQTVEIIANVIPKITELMYELAPKGMHPNINPFQFLQHDGYIYCILNINVQGAEQYLEPILGAKAFFWHTASTMEMDARIKLSTSAKLMDLMSEEISDEAISDTNIEVQVDCSQFTKNRIFESMDKLSRIKYVFGPILDLVVSLTECKLEMDIELNGKGVRKARNRQFRHEIKKIPKVLDFIRELFPIYTDVPMFDDLVSIIREGASGHFRAGLTTDDSQNILIQGYVDSFGELFDFVTKPSKNN